MQQMQVPALHSTTCVQLFLSKFVGCELRFTLQHMSCQDNAELPHAGQRA